MVLAIDVGNTQTAFGVFAEGALVEDWRIATEPERTGDEIGALVDRLFELRGLRAEDVGAVCLASTVPALVNEYLAFIERYLQAESLVVGPGVRTGIPVRVDDPREVGPDRIANAVGALERYGAPCIVVDFGTATNFDAVSAAGEYIGGVIAPGIETSMDALFARAARLVKVDFVCPPAAIGRNTVNALQSGFVFGFAGQVDGIVARMREELGEQAPAIATGGLASLIAPYSTLVREVDRQLTLEGLRLIWNHNA
ncbi:MAG: type III pantothenate kinase [Actinomycetia bacterium]|nr:type III pantothenate kinase [Actinomycetes bacterium]